MIDSLAKLVSFRSVSEYESEEFPYGRETDEAVNYMLGLAKDFGFRTSKKNGYAYAEIGEGKELIGILSHIDVVPEGDGWTYRPFEATIKEERIYGRGTIDDKGPSIAVLYAMKDILDNGVPQKRVRLILGQSEENGDWKDIESYKKHEELPCCGFTPDGDFPAIFCEKGSLVLRVSMPLELSGIAYAEGGIAPNMVPEKAVVRIAEQEFEGKGKAFHGCAPWLGSNAIGDAFRQAGEVGFEDVAFVKMFNELFGMEVYGESLGVSCSDEMSGELTINIGMITTTETDIVMKVDIRYPVIADADEILNIISEKIGKHGAIAECIYQSNAKHMERDSIVLESLLKAYRDVSGDMGEPVSVGGSTYAKAMDNIVAFGPNFPGHENREHRSDEYILISDFLMLRKIYAMAICNMLQ